jgi:hypothetical protein
MRTKIKKTNIVQELKTKGYTVDVRHFRHGKDQWGEELLAEKFNLKEIYPRGGVTNVKIYPPNSKKPYFGNAKCCLKDNFNKHVAVDIAISRALVKEKLDTPF